MRTNFSGGQTGKLTAEDNPIFNHGWTGRVTGKQNKSAIRLAADGQSPHSRPGKIIGRNEAQNAKGKANGGTEK